MKIGVWHNLPSGGGLRALCDQLHGLAERGHELEIWCPPSAASCGARVAHVPTHTVALQRPEDPGRRLATVRAVWQRRRADLEAFDDHSARCAREIEAFGAEVVLAHSCQFFRVPAIARHLRIPSAVYLHEPNRRLFEATLPGYPFRARLSPRKVRPVTLRRFVDELLRVERARIQVAVETASVAAFDEVLVNSAFSRESVLRAYGRLSRISPLGIDVERFPFQERPARSRATVLSVGAMVAEKNAPFVVRAVARAAPAVSRLVWVANYVDRRCGAEVERVAAEVGVELELRVAISDAELLRSYAEADAFVYAPRLEPFGLAPLEAGATGLPVVAVAEGGVRETVVDGVNGVLVDHDEDAFGTAVAELLNDISRARRLGRSAHEHVVRCWPLPEAIDRLDAQLRATSAR